MRLRIAIDARDPFFLEVPQQRTVTDLKRTLESLEGVAVPQQIMLRQGSIVGDDVPLAQLFPSDVVDGVTWLAPRTGNEEDAVGTRFRVATWFPSTPLLVDAAASTPLPEHAWPCRVLHLQAKEVAAATADTSPQETWVGSPDGVLHVWRQGRLTHSTPAHAGAFVLLAQAAGDARLVLTAGRDGTLRLWAGVGQGGPLPWLWHAPFGQVHTAAVKPWILDAERPLLEVLQDVQVLVGVGHAVQGMHADKACPSDTALTWFRLSWDAQHGVVCEACEACEAPSTPLASPWQRLDTGMLSLEECTPRGGVAGVCHGAIPLLESPAPAMETARRRRGRVTLWEEIERKSGGEEEGIPAVEPRPAAADDNAVVSADGRGFFVLPVTGAMVWARPRPGVDDDHWCAVTEAGAIHVFRMVWRTESWGRRRRCPTWLHVLSHAMPVAPAHVLWRPPPPSAAASPHSHAREFVAVDHAGTISMHDVLAGRVRTVRGMLPTPVVDAAWSPDGRTIAFACLTQHVYLLDWPQAMRAQSRGEPEEVPLGFSVVALAMRARQVAWSPDSTLLAVAGHSSTLTILRVAPLAGAGTQAQVPMEPPTEPPTEAPTPTQSGVPSRMTLGPDTAPSAWEAGQAESKDASEAQQGPRAATAPWLMCPAWSPCGMLLAAGTEDGTVYVWQRRPERRSREVPPPQEWSTVATLRHRVRSMRPSQQTSCRAVWVVAWHPTAAQPCLATATHNSPVHVWRFLTPQEEQEAQGTAAGQGASGTGTGTGTESFVARARRNRPPGTRGTGMVVYIVPQTLAASILRPASWSPDGHFLIVTRPNLQLELWSVPDSVLTAPLRVALLMGPGWLNRTIPLTQTPAPRHPWSWSAPAPGEAGGTSFLAYTVHRAAPDAHGGGQRPFLCVVPVSCRNEDSAEPHGPSTHSEHAPIVGSRLPLSTTAHAQGDGHEDPPMDARRGEACHGPWAEGAVLAAWLRGVAHLRHITRPATHHLDGVGDSEERAAAVESDPRRAWEAAACFLHAGSPTGAAWSPNGNALISFGMPGKVRCWTRMACAEGSPCLQEVAPLDTHTYRVTSVAWAPDSRCFVAGTSESVLLLCWQLGEGDAVNSRHDGTATATATDAAAVLDEEWPGRGQGQEQAAQERKEPEAGRGRDEMEAGPWRYARLPVTCTGSSFVQCAWSPCGSHVAAIADREGASCQLVVYDVTEVQVLVHSRHDAASMPESPSVQWRRATTLAWPPAAGEEERPLDMAWSRGLPRPTLAAVGTQGHVYLWQCLGQNGATSVSAGTCHWQLTADLSTPVAQGPLSQVAWAPAGAPVPMLATVSTGGTLTVWYARLPTAHHWQPAEAAHVTCALPSTDTMPMACRVAWCPVAEAATAASAQHAAATDAPPGVAPCTWLLATACADGLVLWRLTLRLVLAQHGAGRGAHVTASLQQVDAYAGPCRNSALEVAWTRSGDAVAVMFSPGFLRVLQPVAAPDGTTRLRIVGRDMKVACPLPRPWTATRHFHRPHLAWSPAGGWIKPEARRDESGVTLDDRRPPLLSAFGVGMRTLRLWRQPQERREYGAEVAKEDQGGGGGGTPRAARNKAGVATELMDLPGGWRLALPAWAESVPITAASWSPQGDCLLLQDAVPDAQDPQGAQPRSGPQTEVSRDASDSGNSGSRIRSTTPFRVARIPQFRDSVSEAGEVCLGGAPAAPQQYALQRVTWPQPEEALLPMLPGQGAAPVVWCSWHPHKAGVVTTVHADGVLRLWEAAFSPAPRDASRPRMWRTVLTDRVSRPGMGSMSRHHHAHAWSPCGTVLACGTDRGWIVLWDVSMHVAPTMWGRHATSMVTRQLPGPPHAVTALAWGPACSTEPEDALLGLPVDDLSVICFRQFSVLHGDALVHMTVVSDGVSDIAVHVEACVTMDRLPQPTAQAWQPQPGVHHVAGAGGGLASSSSGLPPPPLLAVLHGASAITLWHGGDGYGVGCRGELEAGKGEPSQGAAAGPTLVARIPLGPAAPPNESVTAMPTCLAWSPRGTHLAATCDTAEAIVVLHIAIATTAGRGSLDPACSVAWSKVAVVEPFGQVTTLAWHGDGEGMTLWSKGRHTLAVWRRQGGQPTAVAAAAVTSGSGREEQKEGEGKRSSVQASEEGLVAARVTPRGAMPQPTTDEAWYLAHEVGASLVSDGDALGCAMDATAARLLLHSPRTPHAEVWMAPLFSVAPATALFRDLAVRVCDAVEAAGPPRFSPHSTCLAIPTLSRGMGMVRLPRPRVDVGPQREDLHPDPATVAVEWQVWGGAIPSWACSRAQACAWAPEERRLLFADGVGSVCMTVRDEGSTGGEEEEETKEAPPAAVQSWGRWYGVVAAGNTIRVSFLAMSPCGHWLATCSGKGDVVLWQVPADTANPPLPRLRPVILVLSDHEASPSLDREASPSLGREARATHPPAWSPCSRFVAWGGREGRVYIVTLPPRDSRLHEVHARVFLGRMPSLVPWPPGRIRGVTWSPQGHLHGMGPVLVTMDRRNLARWLLEGSSIGRWREATQAGGSSLRHQPQDRDPEHTAWRVERFRWYTICWSWRAAAWSRNGAVLAAGDAHGKWALTAAGGWDTEPYRIMPQLPHGIRQCMWLPSHPWTLALVLDNHSLQVWQHHAMTTAASPMVGPWRCIASMDAVSYVDVSPDGEWLVTSFDHGVAADGASLNVRLRALGGQELERGAVQGEAGVVPSRALAGTSTSWLSLAWDTRHNDSPVATASVMSSSSESSSTTASDSDNDSDSDSDSHSVLERLTEDDHRDSDEEADTLSTDAGSVASQETSWSSHGEASVAQDHDADAADTGRRGSVDSSMSSHSHGSMLSSNDDEGAQGKHMVHAEAAEDPKGVNGRVPLAAMAALEAGHSAWWPAAAAAVAVAAPASGYARDGTGLELEPEAWQSHAWLGSLAQLLQDCVTLTVPHTPAVLPCIPARSSGAAELAAWTATPSMTLYTATSLMQVRPGGAGIRHPLTRERVVQSARPVLVPLLQRLAQQLYGSLASLPAAPPPPPPPPAADRDSWSTERAVLEQAMVMPELQARIPQLWHAWRQGAEAAYQQQRIRTPTPTGGSDSKGQEGEGPLLEHAAMALVQRQFPELELAPWQWLTRHVEAASLGLATVRACCASVPHATLLAWVATASHVSAAAHRMAACLRDARLPAMASLARIPTEEEEEDALAADAAFPPAVAAAWREAPWFATVRAWCPVPGVQHHAEASRGHGLVSGLADAFPGRQWAWAVALQEGKQHVAQIVTAVAMAAATGTPTSRWWRPWPSSHANATVQGTASAVLVPLAGPPCATWQVADRPLAPTADAVLRGTIGLAESW